MHLEFMHDFEVVTRAAWHVDFRNVFVEGRAVVHEEFSDDVGTVEAQLDTVCIVE